MDFLKKKFGILFFILFSVFVISNGEIAFAETVKIEGGEISGERTFVPFRAIFEEFGVDVVWDDTTRTIEATKDDQTIFLMIGSKTAIVNGKNITIDVAPYIKNERTYVPLRFISESLGAEIEWNANSRVATVVYNEKIIKVSTFQLKTYTNDRFSFAINYPSDWGMFPPPTNNDGIVFDTGIADADVRVYGSRTNSVNPDLFMELYDWYFYPERYDTYDLEAKQILLVNGSIATVLVDRNYNDVTTYEMVTVEGGIDYHFYATVPSDFDKDLILSMIHSFRIY